MSVEVSVTVKQRAAWRTYYGKFLPELASKCRTFATEKMTKITDPAVGKSNPVRTTEHTGELQPAIPWYQTFKAYLNVELCTTTTTHIKTKEGDVTW